MKKFEAKELVAAIRSLIHNTYFLESLKAENISSRKTGVLKDLERKVNELLECCNEADLRMSVLAIEPLLLFFRPGMPESAIADSIVHAVKQTLTTIENELSLRLYFSLEMDEAKRYSEPWSGWEKIVERFPDTTRDIEEMNKCFALSRYTASMFHALHVAEWGAIKLGDYIGVTDPKKGWRPTEKKLEELIKGGHAILPASLKGKFEFLEQMHQEIHTMVRAWRHKVDHATNHLAIVPNAEFLPEIAQHIIDSIKVFMARLEEGIPK
jgi:hypothetical protein